MGKHDEQGGKGEMITRADAEEMMRKAAADAAAATVAALSAVNKQNEGPRPDAWRELASTTPNERIRSRLPSGATCECEVQGPQKIVKTLVNYTEPPEAMKSIDEGGVVPNGLEIKQVDGQLTTHYKQWRYDQFLKADLATYVGKPFNASLAIAA